MHNVTHPLTFREVFAAGAIPPRHSGRPERLVVLDTTGPAPVRVELQRAPAPRQVMAP